jgi:hypothetical protein
MRFFCGTGFGLMASHFLGKYTTAWATLPATVCVGCFWDRVLWTICLSWLQSVILLISASWVSRMTVMSHQCLAIKRDLISCFLVHGQLFSLFIVVCVVVWIIEWVSESGGLTTTIPWSPLEHRRGMLEEEQ